MYPSSELIINGDGSVFHLHLKPEQIADKIILVGNRARSSTVAAFFDNIECDKENREFHTITGTYNGKRISVVSTGIGIGNIDIAVNELDALANIDLECRTDKPVRKSLDLVRIGTCGGLQPDTPEGSFVATEYGFGLDGLLYFYKDNERIRETEFESAFVTQTEYNPAAARPYCIKSEESLLQRIATGNIKTGCTITAPGFYAPQGRKLRYGLADEDFIEKVRAFSFDGKKICNMEMESAPLAGLGKLLGHNTLTVCLVIANRYGKSFIGDYRQSMNSLIETVLEKI